MNIWRFRLAYLILTALSLAVVYTFVGAKDEIPFVLSDALMLRLIGGFSLQEYECSGANGCDPYEVGVCLKRGDKWVKYYDWSYKYYCDYTGDPNDYCNQKNEQVVCLKYVYDDKDCQVRNRKEEITYWTECDDTP